ncbi:hypothetical protein D3C76_1759850 [compost metagenome]
MTKQLQSGQPLDVRNEELNFSVWLEGECVADSPAFVDSAARDAAVEALRIALTPVQE